MDRWCQYIQQDPDIMLGKPVIKGTRVTVEMLLERLGAGWTEEELMGSFPRLKPEHIRAALSYAASALATDETVFVPSASP